MLRRTSIDRRDDSAARASLVIAAPCAALAVGAAPSWADEIESEPMVVPSSPKVAADATSEPSDDDWQLEIAPSGWFTSIDGTTASSDVSVSFGDVWDALHFAFFPPNFRSPTLPDQTFHPTSNTAAPILGLRGFLDMTDNWNISFAGDGGGFGVDNMDVTWQAELLGGYRFHHSRFDLNLMIGYKGVGLKNGDDGIDTDLILHGPVLKLGVEF